MGKYTTKSLMRRVFSPLAHQKRPLMRPENGNSVAQGGLCASFFREFNEKDFVIFQYNKAMMALNISYQKEDQLAGALCALGVNFVLGGKDEDRSLFSKPNELIAALAQSSEARLRLSLIPLFLERPEYASYVRKTAKNLELMARLTLQCYYTAAVLLTEKYPELNTTLSNYFADELELNFTDQPEENFRLLAKRHKELSGSHVNWLATYHHAERGWRIGKN
jgi:hypothetical protein